MLIQIDDATDRDTTMVDWLVLLGSYVAIVLGVLGLVLMAGLYVIGSIV